MTAQSIALFTIDFPDPAKIDYDNNKFNTLNSSVSFEYRLPNNFQTLSTKGTSAGNDPYGILYVPDLQSQDCKTQEAAAGVPANATRLANLPQNENYALIAFAPWLGTCMTEYFASARQAPTKGMMVYLLDQGNSQPPVLNDPSWNISDGGSWQRANQFPVYAVSTTTGDNIAYQLGQYSGNLTDVPNGDILGTEFDKSDYIRLWGTVSTDAGNQLPSLWVFLVIVLAILLAAVAITSVAMHMIQRRRRNALRQRVLNGEIDLEALGVKRLTVSQHILDKQPIYTYTGGINEITRQDTPLNAPKGSETSTGNVSAEATSKEVPLVRRSSMPAASTAGTSVSWSQPTCPICLDDFEHNQSKVRELPCHHIFHPECIDPFLLRNSSLCPVCKQSVLPSGVCPVQITNLMVRRERHITRLRARGQSTTSPSHVDPAAPSQRPRAFGSMGSRIGGAITGRRIFSAPAQTQMRPADVEMGNTNSQIPAPDSTSLPTAPPPVATIPPAARECEPGQNRREWARQRALALLGNRHVAPGEADELVDRGPRWKRAFRRVFPGFS